MQKMMQHLFVSIAALFIALFMALPLGFYLSRCRFQKTASFIIRAISLIQTIPGLAMIALIVVVFVYLNRFFHVPTTGSLPGMFALSFYGITPILTNTYIGIRQTNAAMVDVAKGLGMTPKQILFKIKAPHAIPMIMAGVRIAGVWTIGMCTLTSFIGAGGLGDLILQGLRSMNLKYVLAGTIPAAILAVFFEWGMLHLENWLKVDS